MQENALLWIKAQTTVPTDHQPNKRKSVTEYQRDAEQAEMDLQKRKDEAIDTLRILLESKQFHNRTARSQWANAERALKALDAAAWARWQATGGT